MNSKIAVAVILALAVFAASAHPSLDSVSDRLRDAGLEGQQFRDVIDQMTSWDPEHFLINGEHRLCYKIQFRGRLVLCCDDAPAEEEPKIETAAPVADEELGEPVQVFFNPADMFMAVPRPGNRRALQTDFPFINLQFNTTTLQTTCQNGKPLQQFTDCLNDQLAAFANSTSNSTLNSTQFQTYSDDYAQCVQRVTAQQQQASQTSQTCLDSLDSVYQVFAQCGMTSNSTDIVGLAQAEMNCLTQFSQAIDALVNVNAGSKLSYLSGALVLLLALASLF